MDVVVNTPAIVTYQTPDGATDQHPQGYVRNAARTLVFTVPLTHAGDGMYTGFFTPTVAGLYTCTVIDYTDGGHSTPSDTYGNSSDTYRVLESQAQSQHGLRMSTVYNPGSGEQQIIAWLEIDGLRALGTRNLAVIIKDPGGGTAWDGGVASPNSDGVFSIAYALSLTPNQNYYIVVSITDADGNVWTSQQPFFTVAFT